MMRSYKFYKKEVTKFFLRKRNCASVMSVPNLKKIVLNSGIGLASQNKKVLQDTLSDLSMITGQKPVITLSKKSVSSFKIRKGQPIGCKVTLRRKKMWDFFDRLIMIVIPRIRDFRGFSKKSFDGKGNYTIGIKEQIIFPEIKYDKIDCIRGLNVTIVTSSQSNEEAMLFLKLFGFPFKE